MSGTTTYTLVVGETELAVETRVERERGAKRNHARLLVDGDEVDAGGTDEIGDVRLGADAGHPTKVSWWWTGRVAGVALIEEGHGEERHRRVPYAPPPGTRAARRHAWGEAHPRLWAARHVLAWGVSTAAGVIGVSLLVRLLVSWLPSVSLPGLPDLPDLPDVPWPSAPDWWTALWTWVGDTIARVLDLLLGWVPDGPWLKIVVGLVVAIAVAVREVRRRERHRPARAPDSSPSDAPSSRTDDEGGR